MKKLVLMKNGDYAITESIVMLRDLTSMLMVWTEFVLLLVTFISTLNVTKNVANCELLSNIQVVYCID